MDCYIISGCKDGTIVVWNINGIEIQKINYHKKEILCLSSEAYLLAAGSSDYTISIHRLILKSK